MKLGAFEPYGLLVAELYHQALSSDSALRAAVATRRLRYRVVNSIYAKLPSDTESGARRKRWIQLLG
ncbi:MAG TPA: hypothetical protein VEP66_01645 [Myxococcales bacterium]|nr:hypothetical protein [Myxococcales bacterium]